LLLPPRALYTRRKEPRSRWPPQALLLAPKRNIRDPGHWPPEAIPVDPSETNIQSTEPT